MNAATAIASTATPSVNPAVARALAFKRLITGSQRAQIAAQLPKGLDVERFVRTALTTVALKPELLNCTSTSLLGAIMLAAKDGLLPDGKEALIQSYNCNVADKGQPARWEKHAEYQPMVRGLINILYRTGDVALVDGVAVFERDVFEYERGDAPRIVHKPYLGLEDKGPVVAAYCIITLKNGEKKREVMTGRDIASVRAASKAPNGPGWKNWEDQFAIKAVIKRAYKQLPTDCPVLAQVIEHDNRTFDMEQDNKPAPVKVDAKPGEPSRLKAIINQAQPPLEQPVRAAQAQPAESIYFGDSTQLEECPAYDR